MSTLKSVSAVFTLLFAATAFAQDQVPNQFQAGTPARAADVNANFSSVDQRLSDAVTEVDVLVRESSEEGVAGITCPSTHTVISAGCTCSGGASTGRNFGVVFACQTAGNGAAGGCFEDSATALSTRAGPLMTVTATCLGVRRAAGSVEPRALQKQEDDELEIKLHELRSMVGQVVEPSN